MKKFNPGKDAKEMADILFKEHERTKDSVIKLHALHWRRIQEFHEKYPEWNTIKSILLFPIWIIREFRWMKEFNQINKDFNKIQEIEKNLAKE